MDQESRNKDYSVGYKKPPQHTQFRPGQSGNPNGRPKKVPTLAELFVQELLSRISITANDGRRRMISKQQAIAKQFSNKAVTGDHRAARLILDVLSSGRPDSGDNLINLIQEFRLANARQETTEHEQPISGKRKGKR